MHLRTPLTIVSKSNPTCVLLHAGKGLGEWQTGARGLGDLPLRTRRCAPDALGKRVHKYNIQILCVTNKYIRAYSLAYFCSMA